MPPFFMNLILYKTDSAPNAINKALTDAQPVTGTLRERTNILDPVLWVKQDPRAYSYAQIEQFNRYYFIDSIQSVTNGLWEIRLHVDVLMSYQNQIKALPALRTKAERPNAYNDAADYSISVKRVLRKINFPYTFAPDSKLIMIALYLGSGSNDNN